MLWNFMQNHYIIRKIAPFVSNYSKNFEKINNYPLSVQYICLDYPCSTHASAPRAVHSPRLSVQCARLGLSMWLAPQGAWGYAPLAHMP